MTHDWIDQPADLEALIDRLVAEDRYAIDTEFHRERTYFPRLALVQLGLAGRAGARRPAGRSTPTPWPGCSRARRWPSPTPPSRTSTC